MGPGDWPEPEKPSPSSCCVVALGFFSPFLLNIPRLLFFNFNFFFFPLKMSPLLICSGAVAKFSLESRRGDEPKGESRLAALLNHARGGWRSRAALGGEEPRLPSPSRRLWSVRQPFEMRCKHLIRTICTFKTILVFVLPYSAPLSGLGKALLRWDETFGKKIQAFCFWLRDKPISNDVFVANFLYFWFWYLLLQTPAAASFTPEVQLFLQWSLFCTCSNSSSCCLFFLWQLQWFFISLLLDLEIA